MRSAPIIRFPSREGRTLVVRARQAARRLEAGDDRSRGRAWINGREVGGSDPRFAHLALSHD